MLAKALGVDLNIKNLDFGKEEYLSPEFIKINPLHTVPTIVKGDFILYESRAILAYLADKYGKDDSLYPRDFQKRAVVNQRLYFDLGTLYQRSADYYYPQILAKAPADPEKLKKMEEAVGFFDSFLEGTKYAAGDDITIADYSIIAGIAMFATIGFDYARYKNVTRWYEQCKATMKGVELNQTLIEEMKSYMDA